MNYDEQKIEDYIFDRMEEAERSEFQFELVKNKQLRQEVIIIRTLKKIAVAKKTAPPKNDYSKWLVLLVVVLIGFVVFHFLQSNQDKPTIPGIENQTPKSTTLPTIDPDRPIANEENAPREEPTLKEENKKPLPKQNTPTNSPKQRATINPADFTPNEYLENYINSSVRNDDLSVDLVVAEKFIQSQQGQTVIEIKGRVIANN